MGRHDRGADQARDHQRERRHRAAGDVARALQRRRPQVPPAQGRPRRRAALHPPAVLHLGAGPAHRRDRADPARPPGGGRRGPDHVRLDGLHLVQEERAQAARAGRRQGPRRRHRPHAHQLPQPPQDRRHRRRDRLHRRHERRPGVHRRRRALRHLARLAPAPHRPGGRGPREAVRLALVRAQEGPRGPVRRRVHAGARPGRRGDRDARRGGRAGGRRPLERGPPHPHGRHRPGRGVRLDPVAVLHPRLQRLRRDDQRRPQRHRRALHDDRHPGQEDRPVGGADLLPQAHRGRRPRVPVHGRVPPRQDHRRRRHRERSGYDEHGPAQPQAAQRDDGVGVRQGLRPAGRRRVRGRHDQLP